MVNLLVLRDNGPAGSRERIDKREGALARWLKMRCKAMLGDATSYDRMAAVARALWCWGAAPVSLTIRTAKMMQ